MMHEAGSLDAAQDADWSDRADGDASAARGQGPGSPRSSALPLPASPEQDRGRAAPAATARRGQQAHWDAIARGLPDLYAAASTQYYRRREIALFQRHFGELRGKRLLKLDLWNEAINTRILHWAEQQGAEVYGLDLSHVVASRARRNAGEHGDRLRLVEADIRELPFAANAFDLVYTMGTIEHIPEYAQALAEVRRVLRPGGRAIVGVPHRWDLYLRPLFVQVLDRLGKYLYSPERSFSAAELRRTVEASGLRVRAETGLLALPWFLRMADLYFYSRGLPLHRLTPWLQRPFEALESRFELPAALRYLVAVVAEKDPSPAAAP